jgi:hypothetical protein
MGHLLFSDSHVGWSAEFLIPVFYSGAAGTPSAHFLGVMSGANSS